MPHSSVLTAFLMTSMPSKWVTLEEKSHTELDSVSREIVPVRQCLFQLETAGCSTFLVPLLFSHAQIFSDNFPNTVLFYVQLTCDHVNCQLMIATYHPSYLLNIDLSPVCWKLPVPEIIFHLVDFFEPLVPFKNMCTYMVLFSYICWSISSTCNRVFPYQTKNFWLTCFSVFIVYFSMLVDEWPEEKEVETKVCK